MTKEQAETSIKFLENIWSDCEFDNGALRYAVEALEKQIQKKPINYEDGWLYWKCPNCSLRVGENMGFKLPTCYCGQRLDWREVE